METEEKADLETDIRIARQSVDTAQDGVDRARGLAHLGILLSHRYSKTGALGDSEEAIRVTQEAINTTPIGHPACGGFLAYLGIHLSQRYDRAGAPTDLENAVQILRQAAHATPVHHPNRWKILPHLGSALAKRFRATGSLADLNEALEITQNALENIPDDDLHRIIVLNDLGNRFHQKYERTGALTDLEHALQYTQQAVNCCASDDHPYRWKVLNNLSLRLRARFSATGAVEDLEKAFHAAQQSMAVMPADCPDRTALLSGLGQLFSDRYARKGDIADLQMSIQLIEKALTAMSNCDPDLPILLINLGKELNNRYDATGAVVHLNQAIAVTRQALDLLPESHSNRAACLKNLGTQLGNLYLELGALEDLNEAIRFLQQALNATPGNDPNQAHRLNGLAVNLHRRYLRTGTMADLDEAIRNTRKAVDATPITHPDRVGFLRNFAVQLIQRYTRAGVLADLETAIELTREALGSTPNDHPDRAIALNNLGCHLMYRYGRVGAISDLEAAIQMTQDAVDATPYNSTYWRKFLLNQSENLVTSYGRTGAISDLETAIKMAHDLVDVTPNKHLDRPKFMNQLGNCLMIRYAEMKAMADLELAIRLGRETIDSAPFGCVGQATYLDNLGTRLRERFLRSGEMADLEEAIGVTREAVKASSETDTEKACRLYNLGILVSDRFSKSGIKADLLEASSLHRLALNQVTALPLDRINAGKACIRCYAGDSDWQNAFEAAVLTISLISRLSMRMLVNSDRQFILGQFDGLASEAAAVALIAGKPPITALQMIEQGRGVLAASLEELRSDVQDLKNVYPELAQRFIHFRDKLELADTSLESSDQIQSEQRRHIETSGRYEASKAIDEVIDEIRQQSGFENFLLAPQEEEIRTAAQQGSIVVINTSRYGFDAILIEQHRISSIPLLKLTLNDITKKAKAADLGNPKTLSWLWDTVAEPVLVALGSTHRSFDGDLKRIWWIPTGPLTKFPIHAAGHHTEGACKTVLDRAISSYSPSVKAIINGRQRSPQKSQSAQERALLIAVEQTPNMSSLPFANVEIEMVHNICQTMTLQPIKLGAKKEDVISHLSQCQIFHFAGHGHTDYTDPSKSCLILEGGVNDALTVATLLDNNMQAHPPFFAYLSACGTGQIRAEQFFDESIHLISAFQLAGFRHVIGTLWEVNDKICVDIARIVYESIRDRGMSDDSVPWALHTAARHLRDRSLNALGKQQDGSNNVELHFERGRKARSVDDESSVYNRLPRTIVPCDNGDDDEDDDRNKNGRHEGLFQWVPYVHYGV